MKLKTSIAGFLCLALAACNGESNPGRVSNTEPQLLRVTAVRNDKKETYLEFSKKTKIEYTVTGDLEIVEPGRSEAPMIAFIRFRDTAGFSPESNRWRDQGVVMMDGRGEFKIFETRYIRTGQAYPPPPSYEFKVAGIERMLRGRLEMDGESLEQGADSELPKFTMHLPALRLVEDDNSYNDSSSSFYAKSDGVLRGDLATKTRPVRAFLKKTAVTHPDPERVGQEIYITVFLENGEGVFEVSEWFSTKPAKLPEFRIQLLGYEYLDPGKLAPVS